MKLKAWFYFTMLKFISNNFELIEKHSDKMTKEERESFDKIKDGLNKVKDYQDKNA